MGKPQTHAITKTGHGHLLRLDGRLVFVSRDAEGNKTFRPVPAAERAYGR